MPQKREDLVLRGDCLLRQGGIRVDQEMGEVTSEQESTKVREFIWRIPKIPRTFISRHDQVYIGVPLVWEIGSFSWAKEFTLWVRAIKVEALGS